MLDLVHKYGDLDSWYNQWQCLSMLDLVHMYADIDSCFSTLQVV